ncbi:MAG: hypothetical protein ACE5JI_05830, partial [Acidobacteriota bacterium]
QQGEPIPVVGGGRLTGRMGSYELGLLSIQTGAEDGLSLGDNFTVMRLRRNVFASSDIGVMFINRETMNSPQYNRSIGADANFRLTPEMDLNAYVAKTLTPGLSGRDMAGRIAWSYDGRLLQLRTALSTLQDNFNPEVGFAPRIGVRRASNFFGYHHRQSWWTGFLREIYPHLEFEYFSNQDAEVVSRYFNVHLALRMQNGGFFEVGRNQSLEQPFQPFQIHPTTIISPGFYTFSDYFAMIFTDPSRILSANARVSAGDFYSGTRQALQLGGVLKLGEKVTAQVGWSYNNIGLQEGSFNTHLLTSRFIYSFSTNMFLNGLIQYNSITEEWTSNIRFNLIHRPLSDFFLVYNDRRDETGRRIDRAIIAKFTYLLQL